MLLIYILCQFLCKTSSVWQAEIPCSCSTCTFPPDTCYHIYTWLLLIHIKIFKYNLFIFLIISWCDNLKVNFTRKNIVSIHNTLLLDIKYYGYKINGHQLLFMKIGMCLSVVCKALKKSRLILSVPESPSLILELFSQNVYEKMISKFRSWNICFSRKMWGKIEGKGKLKKCLTSNKIYIFCLKIV